MEGEQRQYVRLSLESTVFIELMSAAAAGDEEAKVARCKTLDISRGGLRVRIARS